LAKPTSGILGKPGAKTKKQTKERKNGPNANRPKENN